MAICDSTTRYAEEWQRSKPDITVYLPKDDGGLDGDNEHFLVTPTASGELLAIWTQSRVEGSGTNHAVYAHSRDGKSWTAPTYLCGYQPGISEKQASWAFPVVSAKGRVYCFYCKETDVWDMWRHFGGALGCHYSDDNGHTWVEGTALPFPRTRYDHICPAVPPSWIVFQIPVRDSKGRLIAGYTRTTSRSRSNVPDDHYWNVENQCYFLRFENIDDNPDPADLQITSLPLNGEGLRVPNPNYAHISAACEPSVVLLPDGRLFATIRSHTGHIWYSVSENDGDTWRRPQKMCYRDVGEPILQPAAPCPIYRMADGRYLLLFHNNDGRRGIYSQHEKTPWVANPLCFIRNPAYISMGEYQPQAVQPIWFSRPKLFADSGDMRVGPKGTAEMATYTSFTDIDGKRVLWYPDRKYYLLGKYITDEYLMDMND